MAAGRFDLKALWRLLAPALALVLASVLLSACSGQNQPFSKATKPPGRTPPAIIVRSMTGLPADMETLLFNSLVAAAGPRDIAIVKGEFQGGYSLSGEFQAVPGADGVVLNYRWTLLSDKGQQLHSIANSEPGRPVAGDPWTGIDPDTLRRVAGYTAESLSSRLSQLGFATQTAGLLPPADTFVKAGPGAEKDIDPELYGRLAAAIMAPQPAAASANDPPDLAAEYASETVPEDAVFPEDATTDATETSAPTQPVSNDPSSRKGDKQTPEMLAAAEQAAVEEPEAPKSARISAVAVTVVKGSPGKGNGELLAAMRKVLRDAGWPVLPKAQRNALSIDGKVLIGEAEGSTQSVELQWTVKLPDGTVLGTVKQQNRVALGSLDKGWGESAGYAAQGAAEGIFNLVNKAKKSL